MNIDIKIRVFVRSLISLKGENREIRPKQRYPFKPSGKLSALFSFFRGDDHSKGGPFVQLLHGFY